MLHEHRFLLFFETLLMILRKINQQGRIYEILVDNEISTHMPQSTSIILLEETSEKHVKYLTTYMDMNNDINVR